ncbi:hypothetical protein [Coleofasciculus sp. FACHB-129]|uniref:hypothetical protein n=1 Tax=Cyanophyceae TaxID=3028117 RepID=UPI0016874EE0|nr:hypothetical protein [Coleofasciculus sp. FACHB-129]MBD1895932.1 hypothetical protein [Coleofasciculus sp. FACHB-129]
MVNSGKTPTREQTDAYDFIYTYFNRELFNNELPECVLTLSPKAGEYGCFLPDKWDKNGVTLSGIQLSPVSFERHVQDVLAALCRQMVNVWQYNFGKKKPARQGYCNEEWKAKMREVGLNPIDIGDKWNVDHEVVKNGKFEQAINNLPMEKLIPWKTKPSDEPERSKGGKRVKYTCPKCDLNARSRPNVRIACWDCKLLMEASTN